MPPPPQLQQSNFTLVLILVRQQRIEGSVNIQTPTFVIIGWETATKYIFPEMLLITIGAFSPEVAFFVLLTFPCTQNVCHRHLPMPSQLLLCRQKHWGDYKRAKVKPLPLDKKQFLIYILVQNPEKKNVRAPPEPPCYQGQPMLRYLCLRLSFTALLSMHL